MGIVFMIVAGAILGWTTAFMLGSDTTKAGLRLNIAGGIAGALIAGLIVSPSVGTGSLLGSSYSVAAIMMCMIGAIALLLPLNLLQSRILR